MSSSLVRVQVCVHVAWLLFHVHLLNCVYLKLCRPECMCMGGLCVHCSVATVEVETQIWFDGFTVSRFDWVNKMLPLNLVKTRDDND